jgi:hypothetical protein
VCALLVPYRLSDGFLQISVVINIVMCQFIIWSLNGMTCLLLESKDIKLQGLVHILPWYNLKATGSNF